MYSSVEVFEKIDVLSGCDPGFEIGWEAGIRTPIPWSRATCPTVGRPPSTSQGVRDRRETPIIANPNARQQGASNPLLKAGTWLALGAVYRIKSSRCSCLCRSSAPVGAAHHPAQGRPGHTLPGLFLLPAMTGHAALATRLTRFVARPLVSRALLMRGFAALARNLALFVSVHRCKSAIFCGHYVLLGCTNFTACPRILPLQPGCHGPWRKSK